MTDYPELEKQSKAREEGRSHEIGAFLDWMQAEGIHFMTWGPQTYDAPCSLLPGVHGCGGRGYVHEGEPWASEEFHTAGVSALRVCLRCGGTGEREHEREAWIEDSRRIEQWLADYFEIDLTKIEQERRALLDEIRAQRQEASA